MRGGIVRIHIYRSSEMALGLGASLPRVAPELLQPAEQLIMRIAALRALLANAGRLGRRQLDAKRASDAPAHLVLDREKIAGAPVVTLRP